MLEERRGFWIVKVGATQAEDVPSGDGTLSQVYDLQRLTSEAMNERVGASERCRRSRIAIAWKAPIGPFITLGDMDYEALR